MQSDWEFCQEGLRAVSRTFSQPIEVLPDELCRAVTCGYLLCRVADTIEDNESFDVVERDERYGVYLEVLHGSADPRTFEHLWEDVSGSPEGELIVARQVHRVLAVLSSVQAEMRATVLRWVAEMTRGMQIYSHRPAGPDGIVALSNADDLQRYCYFVAGTVGHMLTELFVTAMELPESDPRLRILRENAEAFGTGLQLVNILKDITDDLERGWSFVPQTIWTDRRLGARQLADPSRRPNAHRSIEPMFDLARNRLDRALRYALAIPVSHPRIRLFCLLPLWMAVKTVVHARGNDAVFTTGESVKISRAEVRDIVELCTKHCTDDAFLRSEYETMWRDAWPDPVAIAGATAATRVPHTEHAGGQDR